MSLSDIRHQFSVPAHRGRRIAVQGRRAVILGASGQRLRVRFDGDEQPNLVHPTDGVVYQSPRGAHAEWHPITHAEPAPLVDVMLSAFIPGEPLPSVFFGWRRHTDPTVFLISGSETNVVPGTVYAYAEEPCAAPLPATLVAVASDTFAEGAVA